MSTIPVKDANELEVAIEKPLAPGRAAATASKPIVLSNEDKAVLDAIVTALGVIDGRVDGLEALITLTNGYVDGLEALITLTNGYVDGLETAVAATNTKLDTLIVSNAAIKVAAESTGVVNVATGAKITPTTLSVDTAALANGDVVADSEIIAACFFADDIGGTLGQAMLVDASDQATPCSYRGVYFRSNVSLGTENAAPSISDANAIQIMGTVDFLAADWVDLGGVKYCQCSGVQPSLLGRTVQPVTGTDDMYFALYIIAGAGGADFVAATDLALITGIN